MTDKHLHIITHDVPWPADNGGVIDVYYKILWLHKCGVKIHLHCFTKGRKKQAILNDYCESVAYYRRKTGINGISISSPYIVSSRRSKALLSVLNEDRHPILFEGIHSTYWLFKNKLTDRGLFLRLHNAETKYYEQLASHEHNLLKRTYFRIESKRLKNYEELLCGSARLLAISDTDAVFFRDVFSAKDVHLIRAFTEWNEVNTVPGKGNYCLYHGNLSVNENEAAALWLIEKVFADLPLQLVIAGHQPSVRLRNLVSKFPTISLCPDPSHDQLKQLILNAHINVLPSFNSTGVKIKLLAALFNGRHCLVNTATIAGSGLESLCIVAQDARSFRSAVSKLFEAAFTMEDIEQKKAILSEKYSNQKNAQLLISLIR